MSKKKGELLHETTSYGDARATADREGARRDMTTRISACVFPELDAAGNRKNGFRVWGYEA